MLEFEEALEGCLLLKVGPNGPESVSRYTLSKEWK